MSVKAINWAFELHVPPVPKLILLVLANYADENGYSFPGIERIAHHASIGTRTAIRWLNRLEENGYLERHRRHLENGNRTSNGYRLIPDGDYVTDWHIDQVPNQDDQVPTVSPIGEPPVEPPVTPTARAHAMPRDMTWNNAHSLKAHARGVDIEVEFEKFRDYHLAKGSVFKDWDRALHHWLNNARPEAGFRKHPDTRLTATERMHAVLALEDPTERTA